MEGISSQEIYPFLQYIEEDKSDYIHAKDFKIDIEDATKTSLTQSSAYWNNHKYRTYNDPDDLFLVGESGGFLMNINSKCKFINTEQFYEVADYYRSHKGTYTQFKTDSIPHRQFRKREQFRRKNGITKPALINEKGDIVDVSITGSHYNFLNYVRMEQLDESSITHGAVDTARKHYDFPKFIDAQFWTFHVMKFSELNGFHLLIDKTRRGGFSYMMAADSANTVNCQSRKIVIHVAVDKKYLTQTGGLTDFAVNDLKFYEEVSPFVRGILSPVKSDFRLGYKLPSGVEADKSWRSALISVTAHNNPDCAIGKDAVKVKVEEVSTMDNFDDFMEVTEPAMRTGAYTTGHLTAWGTATSGNMQTFEQNFYNVMAYHFMPFENVWDKDCRNETCGFFKSYAWGLQGEYDGKLAMDKDGNSDLRIGLKIANRERKLKKQTAKSYSEYINYLGQYALMPSESFSSVTENIFSSEQLSAWEEVLRVDTSYKFYVDGMIEMDGNRAVFKSNERLASENKKVYDYILGVPRRAHEDPHGCIRRWFAPELREVETARGTVREVPEGLYSITYDPVGVDKDKKEITNKHSHNSIKVWMNPDISNGFKQKLVASYYGRPDKLEEADYICYMLAVYYNCVKSVNVEVNRGETVSNFKKWKATRYLGFEPLFVWDATLKGKVSTSYGYSIGPNNKLEGIRLLKEFLYDEIGKDEFGNPIYNFHRILDYQSILELKKWNSEGNFDRVSEMLLRGIEWKGMKLKNTFELDSHKHIDSEEEATNIMNREWFTD